jgi:hypothetical protein
MAAYRGVAICFLQQRFAHGAFETGPSAQQWCWRLLWGLRLEMLLLLLLLLTRWRRTRNRLLMSLSGPSTLHVPRRAL